MADFFSELESAWSWREKRLLFSKTDTLRVFHGPGEGSGPATQFAIDRFQDHFWVTHWEKSDASHAELHLKTIARFLAAHGAKSAVILHRPSKGVPEEPVILLGDPPAGRFSVRENQRKFLIQLLGARHPGLFLDHAPLRDWLERNSKGWSVLNTFSYTGSLSVACGVGGAAQVTTLDLARTAIDWAAENWKLNGLSEASARFLAGDVFEWFPRLRKEGRRFDCVILDPPSFSRGKRGSFSTSKDLPRLHDLAFDVLAPEGVLVTSINSAQITPDKYESEILSVARKRKIEFDILEDISLPETFPTRPGDATARYLKGWILKRRPG